jgi:hypothetical protein
LGFSIGSAYFPIGSSEEDAGTARSHARETDTTRLLFQKVHVEAVPVHEVVYEYRRPPGQRLWVYGHQRWIHAPRVPRPWLRLLLLLAILGGTIAAAVWAAIRFL